jgi:hypothetical protein
LLGFANELSESASNNFRLSNPFRSHGMQHRTIKIITEKSIQVFQFSAIPSPQYHAVNIIPDDRPSQIILDEKARDAFYLGFLK